MTTLLCKQDQHLGGIFLSVTAVCPDSEADRNAWNPPLSANCNPDLKEGKLSAEQDAQKAYNDKHPENNGSSNFLHLYPFYKKALIIKRK